MPVSPLPLIQQLFDDNGLVLSAGLVNTYVVGTLVPVTTYSDIDVPNTNPVVADSSGRVSIWYDGDVRCIVTDANGVLIRDFNTTSPLRSDTISDAMLPVVGAPTITQAVNLLQIPELIQASVNALSLLTGPTGPAGASVVGPTGPTGATGSGYVPLLVGSNPGYAAFPSVNGTSANLYVQFGESASDGSGNLSVSFSHAFPNACLVVVASAGSTSWWANVTSKNTSGFTGTTSSPLHGGSWVGGPVSCSWIAVGY